MNCKNGHKLTIDKLYKRQGANLTYIECRDCRKLATKQSKIRHGYNTWLFGGHREEVIARDHNQCTGCGMTRSEHKFVFGKDITIDHKDGFGSTVPVSMKNNSLDNLVTLCLSCHGRKDNARRRILIKAA